MSGILWIIIWVFFDENVMISVRNAKKWCREVQDWLIFRIFVV